MFNLEEEIGHIATGNESLAEYARNAGMDNPERCWLLDGRDVWVRNPFYHGVPEPHPEYDDEHYIAPVPNTTPLTPPEDIPF